MLSDLEILVVNDMIALGFEPCCTDDINEFWELKLDDN